MSGGEAWARVHGGVSKPHCAGVGGTQLRTSHPWAVRCRVIQARSGGDACVRGTDRCHGHPPHQLRISVTRSLRPLCNGPCPPCDQLTERPLAAARQCIRWSASLCGEDLLMFVKLLLSLLAVGVVGTAVVVATVPDTPSAKQAIVTHLVDGDTFDVSIDGHTERIRMLNIDTPEIKDP